MIACHVAMNVVKSTKIVLLGNNIQLPEDLIPENIVIINTDNNNSEENLLTREFLDLSNHDFNILNNVSKLVNDLEPDIKCNKEIVSPKIVQFFEGLVSCYYVSALLVTDLEMFISEDLYNQDIKYIGQFLKNFHDRKKELLDFVNNHEIVFFVLQKSFITYVNSYVELKEHQSLTSDDQLKNLNTELTLLKDIQVKLGLLKATIAEINSSLVNS
jgi:hypothetical protein